MLDPVPILWGEFRIPFETVLKKQMCGIELKSPEELFANPLMKKRTYYLSPNVTYITEKNYSIWEL